MARDRLGGGSVGPIVETDNLLHGALRRPDADASMGEARARSTAWWSLGLALLWGFGLFSLLAVGLGAGAIVGLRNAAVRGAPLVAAIAGVALGVVGIVVVAITYL
jgi:hypothetical protein